MTMNLEVYSLDVKEALRVLREAQEYCETHHEDVAKARLAARPGIMGMIATAIEEGIISNGEVATTRLRDKLFVAFEIGVCYGKKFPPA